MKQARRRPLPTITKLYSSARRARRAMAKAFAAVSASEKRMRRREQEHASTREALERMLSLFDNKRHGGEAMPLAPVGCEVLPAGSRAPSTSTDKIDDMLASVDASNKRIAVMESKAVEDMRKFMQAATPIKDLDLKALINKGRA